ncbi:MAG: TorF family putative porin [Planctomycetota bacterium]
MSIGQKFLTSALCAGLGVAAFSASAQEEAPGLNNGAVSFAIGVDVPTKYIFRGFEIEENGLILQPYAEASFAIAEGVDFYIGTWNSIHENETGTTAASSNDEWFESDLYAGVSLRLFDPISLDVSYVHYLYPSNTFGDYKEINLAIGYDDSEMLGEYAVSPYALLAFEFDTTSAGDDDNIYLELGGEWGMSLVESEDYPIDLTIPVAIGLSLDEFYVDADGDNEFFGFISVGANLGMPLTFIPSEFGSWSAGAGLTLFILNDEAGLDDGSNDDFNLVGTLGIAMEY